MQNKIYFKFLLLFLFSSAVLAQNAEVELGRVKQRLDSIQSFSAALNLELDIRFIEMPPKNAKIFYQKGRPLEFEASEFVMLPKKGLDFTMQELFKYPYLTVDRGLLKKNGVSYRQLRVIPQDHRAEFAIAPLLIANQKDRIVQSEISTKKHGTYIIDMAYGPKEMPLPDSVSIKFEIQDVKLPIQYLSNKTEMEVDKKSVRQEGINEGYIYLRLTDYLLYY